jgi:hypothetical protein
MQRTFFERTKLVAGAVLVTLGILILQENLCRTAVQLSDLLGRSPQEALGALPSIILGASKLAQGYAAGHQQFLEGVLHKMAVSSWPLLLVVVGTALSRIEKKIVHLSIRATRCSTLK